ncbi:MAG: NifB/NifX family molybdenum-iron cluster-binding protein [Candidatus Thermoplasmatota archaeon]|nr:NifB/NifX family molybdenum-iron cluster-binding protein [Candidatus Thermoplasmatota archaeon]
MKLCVPSMLPGGLMAPVAPHFSRAPCYTIVSIYGDGNKGVEVMHNYSPGDPAMPAKLMGMGVQVVVVEKIDRQSLELLWGCMMRVFLGAVGSVDDTINNYRNGFLAEATFDSIE